MKLAVLVQCHKNPEQINLFLDAMHHRDVTFFVHVDKKSNISDSIVKREDVFILPDDLRVNVQWAHISQVDAILNLMRYASGNGEYDFFWLCSGQCFPLKSPDEMIAWFEEYRDHDFVELVKHGNGEDNFDKRNAVFYPKWIQGNKLWKRIARRLYIELTGGYYKTYSWARRKPVDGLKFYYGSNWICLRKKTLDWILKYLEEHPQFYSFYENCNTPDESFFQTLLMNSPYADNRMAYLHYVDWSEGKNNPKILTMSDIESMRASGKLMARKFDIAVDADVLNHLKTR